MTRGTLWLGGTGSAGSREDRPLDISHIARFRASVPFQLSESIALVGFKSNGYGATDQRRAALAATDGGAGSGGEVAGDTGG